MNLNKNHPITAFLKVYDREVAQSQAKLGNMYNATMNEDLIFTATAATATATATPVHYNDQVTHYPQPQLQHGE
tara:strand:+ start:1171 stop:1392 length:222 start_codon:yes stop_codon:yes gene_type:complete